MKKLANILSSYGMILLGNFLIAVGAVFFIVPGNFITGGVTGLALAIEQFFRLPLPLGIAACSVLLFLVGLIFLGWKFALSTLVSTVSYPAFVWLCQWLTDRFALTTDSTVLNLAGATFFFAYGVALVMRQGASTGGLDTVSMILQGKAGIPAAKTVVLFEIATLIPQLPYSTIEGIFGGVLVSVVYTALLDNLLAKGIAKIQVQIYSKKVKAIQKVIIDKFERGCTLFQILGGYTGEEGFALQTVIANRELFRLKKEVKAIDPHAFVTVSQVSEVSGLGFSYDEENL